MIPAHGHITDKPGVWDVYGNKSSALCVVLNAVQAPMHIKERKTSFKAWTGSQFPQSLTGNGGYKTQVVNE